MSGALGLRRLCAPRPPHTTDHPVEARYVGMTIGDEYVVGYGLDFEERYRNLPVVVAADPAVLRTGGFVAF